MCRLDTRLLGSAERNTATPGDGATDVLTRHMTADAGVKCFLFPSKLKSDICTLYHVAQDICPALQTCSPLCFECICQFSSCACCDKMCDAGEDLPENEEDLQEQIVPHGSYVYERRPNMPKSFMTKQGVKRASKKEQKLARRAQRGTMQQAGQLLTPEPTAVATNLHYGKFEQHTTGYGSRMMARWGFAGQGAGLGRDQQGIAEPVAAFARPKKLGLGHN